MNKTTIFLVCETRNETYGHGCCGEDTIVLLVDGYDGKKSDRVAFKTFEAATAEIKSRKPWTKYQIIEVPLWQ